VLAGVALGVELGNVLFRKLTVGNTGSAVLRGRRGGDSGREVLMLRDRCSFRGGRNAGFGGDVLVGGRVLEDA